MNNESEINRKIEIFLLINTKAYLEAPGRDLEKVDKEFQELISLSPKNHKLLFQYNEFRIAHLSKLSKTRPQILISGAFGMQYPNLHSYPLFEIADVICLTCIQHPLPYASSLHCHPLSQFYDILKRLPKNFEPDFYWDNQIEHKHFIPAGIETAPFPIIASVCHTFLHKSIEHICELFDWVCPISKFYGDILKRKYSEKVLDIPFGLNWASLDSMLLPCWDKTIDVCLTFSENDFIFFYNHRNRVRDLVKKFKQKYGTRFSIEIVSNLPQERYIEVLRKSRIAINVTAINGPYNYRFIEAISCGTMVFQYDWKGEFFENDFSELFVEDVHGAVFNYENFESKLLFYLENPDKTRKIAQEALLFLQENYNYKKLYQKLIDHVKETPLKLPRDVKPYQGYHHLDMIYYNQSNVSLGYINYGVLASINGTDWISFNNLMVLSCTYPQNSHAFQLFLAVTATPLAKNEKTDVWSLCCGFYKKAITNAPHEYSWIIRWNFLLLSLEKDKTEKSDLVGLIAVLQEGNLDPFEEERLIFKYYVDSPSYPKYQLPNLATQEFAELNMDLIKVIDKPQERATLYRNYALKASKYFLEILTR